MSCRQNEMGILTFYSFIHSHFIRHTRIGFIRFPQGCVQFQYWQWNGTHCVLKQPELSDICARAVRGKHVHSPNLCELLINSEDHQQRRQRLQTTTQEADKYGICRSVLQKQAPSLEERFFVTWLNHDRSSRATTGIDRVRAWEPSFSSSTVLTSQQQQQWLLEVFLLRAQERQKE